VISQNAKWGHAGFYIDCHRMTVPENILLQKKHCLDYNDFRNVHSLTSKCRRVAIVAVSEFDRNEKRFTKCIVGCIVSALDKADISTLPFAIMLIIKPSRMIAFILS